MGALTSWNPLGYSGPLNGTDLHLTIIIIL